MKKIKVSLSQVVIIISVSIFAILCLLPFMMVLSGSLSTEMDIVKNGYTLIPLHPTLVAYKILLFNSNRILNAYKISILVTIIGTILGLFVNTMAAYTMAHRKLKYKKFISLFILITILFNGGLVPWYIVCVNYLHLKDNFAALIIPAVANSFNIFLIRNYMISIPKEMHECSKIDGAKEFRIFYQIILPLCLPVLATVGLFTSLTYWNDWFLGLMLIDKQELQPLQLNLRILVTQYQFLLNSQKSLELQRIMNTTPAESLKMAVCIITIGPVVLVYPFLQKYFVKGIMLGAVKS